MRVTFKRLSAAIGAMALASLIAPTRAHAAFIIEFDDVAIHGGTVKQSGNVITGKNVLFDLVTLEDETTGQVLAAAQCGLVAAANQVCVMNFTFTVTNPVTHTGTGTISMKTQTGLYDAGPDKAPFTGDTGSVFLPAPPSATVFSGSLDIGGFVGSPTSAKTFGAEGDVQVAPELIDFFQILVAGDLSLTTTEIRTATNGVVFDADAVANGDIQLIPEPGLLSLFGVGLLAVGRRFRRK